MLLSDKKERILAICDHVDEPESMMVREISQSEKDNTIGSHLHSKNEKQNKTKPELSDIGDRLVATRDGGRCWRTG